MHMYSGSQPGGASWFCLHTLVVTEARLLFVYLCRQHSSSKYTLLTAVSKGSCQMHFVRWQSAWQCILILSAHCCDRGETIESVPLQAAQQQQVHSTDGWSGGGLPDALGSSKQEDGLAGLLLPHGHLVMKLLQVMLLQPALK